MRCKVRAKGMVSRTWSRPQIQATARSMPMPKPEWGTPAMPISPKAQNASVKCVLFPNIVNDISHVNHVRTQWIHRNRERVRRRLHELNPVSLRVLHFEVLASIARLADRSRHRYIVSRQIFPQLLSIGRVVSGVIETIDRCRPRWQRQNLHKLNCVEVIADAHGILRVCSFECTQVVNIERLRLGGVRAVDTQVRDAGDRSEEHT